MGTQRIFVDPRWTSSSRNALVAWDLSRALRWAFKGKNDRRALGWMFGGRGGYFNLNGRHPCLTSLACLNEYSK